MSVRTRSVTTEAGDYLRVIEWSSTEREYETIVCEYPVDEPETFIVRGFKADDDEDDPSYRDVFEMRELSFTPISIAGLGERERLTGVSSTGGGGDMADYDRIPVDVRLSLQSIGFTAVPRGQGWLDGV